jgi:hypothetical protein
MKGSAAKLAGRGMLARSAADRPPPQRAILFLEDCAMRSAARGCSSRRRLKKSTRAADRNQPALVEPPAPRRRLFPMRRNVATAVTAALCATATACGGLSSTGPSTSRPSGPTPSPRAAVTIAASDAENGRTMTVRVGDRVSVVLDSTYWSFAGSSNAGVMAPAGRPSVSPMPSGCVPGGGCGTVTATFLTIAPGSAQVSASRTTCGEALRCTGSAGSYRLIVEVTSSG